MAGTSAPLAIVILLVFIMVQTGEAVAPPPLVLDLLGVKALPLARNRQQLDPLKEIPPFVVNEVLAVFAGTAGAILPVISLVSAPSKLALPRIAAPAALTTPVAS